MQLRLEHLLLLLEVCSLPSLSQNNNCEDLDTLIPACDEDGGPGRRISEDLPQIDIDVFYEYSNDNLSNIKIYHNGTVDFNDGSLSIAVFGANLTDKEYAHFIYDFDNNDSVPYVARQKNHVIGLLDAASVDCQITNFFIVTWMNYSYCDTHNTSFQLAIAATSAATYALLLYEGVIECNQMEPLITGFRTDESCGYLYPTVTSEDVESLWQSSNINIPGVFLYEISTMECIRLVDINDDVNGRNGTVEVHHNGEWRSVCDDYWTDVEADVACGQLGLLPYGAEAFRKKHFKDGATIAYWLDDVNCHGNESSLFECTHKMIGNCQDRERAAVRCRSRNHIGIRLVGGNSTKGKIELRYNDQWKPVCASFWSQEDAKVACKELCLPYSGAMAMSEEETGENFWMDYVHCRGDEDSLFACRHMGVGTVHGGTCRKSAAVHCI